MVETLTCYPATATDGWVYKTGAAVWSTVHDAVVGSAYDTSDLVRERAIHARSSVYRIARSFFLFDTSGLPDDCTIVGVTLSIWGYVNSSGQVCLQEATPYATLNNDVYANFTGGLVADVDTSWATDAYNVFTLYEASFDIVSKTGNTYLCLREYEHDYLDVPVVADSMDGVTFAEYSGTTRDPKLVISYTESIVVKEVAGAIIPSGVLTTDNIYSKTLAGSITPSGVLAIDTKYLQSLSGSITPTGTLSTSVIVPTTLLTGSRHATSRQRIRRA